MNFIKISLLAVVLVALIVGGCKKTDVLNNPSDNTIQPVGAYTGIVSAGSDSGNGTLSINITSGSGLLKATTVYHVTGFVVSVFNDTVSLGGTYDDSTKAIEFSGTNAHGTHCSFSGTFINGILSGSYTWSSSSGLNLSGTFTAQQTTSGTGTAYFGIFHSRIDTIRRVGMLNMAVSGTKIVGAAVAAIDTTFKIPFQGTVSGDSITLFAINPITNQKIPFGSGKFTTAQQYEAKGTYSIDLTFGNYHIIDNGDWDAFKH